MDATGVYIGKLEPRMRPIAEDDNDKAHLEEETVEVIKYKHATPSHEKIMVGAVLNPEQGIAHELFQEGEEGGAAAEEEGVEEKEEKEKDILDTEKFKYIPEVVTESKMHYWQVPRLGSYMAIPLIYNSCLYEDSVDAALNDYIEKKKLKDEQEKDR